MLMTMEDHSLSRRDLIRLLALTAAGTCAALAAITIAAITIMARRIALMDPAIVFRS